MSEYDEHDHINMGLRGLETASSEICLIKGDTGQLFYRGFNIEDLAKNSSYEEVAYLLVYGEIPNREKLTKFDAQLKKERKLPKEILMMLDALPKDSPPMAVLQASVALLSASCPELPNDSKQANQRKAIRIVARMPCVVSAWERRRNDLEIIEPDSDLAHAENFLYMLTGEKPSSKIARAFDIAMMLHAEHSFNASTFTARVIASTRAHLYACVAGAIGSLSGELHGGANAKVMENLFVIGGSEKVSKWVHEQFEEKRRIMGMGHAVYKTLDPRAKILRGLAQDITSEMGEDKWVEIATQIVKATQAEFRKRKDREIYPNVDLYSGSIYYTLGIPVDLFTPIFAMARTAGWVAHILEEKFPKPPIKPVIYRPSAHYRGDYCGEEGCVYVPVEERV